MENTARHDSRCWGSDPELAIYRIALSDSRCTVVLEVEPASAGDSWILRVKGRNQQVSEWLDRFDTPVEAIIAGLSAVQHDGIAGFYQDPVLVLLDRISTELLTDA